MKSSFKKIMVLCLAFVLLVLSGCSGAKETESDSGARTVTFYFPGEARKDAKMVIEEMENQMRDSLNIDLEFSWIPFSDYTNKINVLLASGDEYEGHSDADWRNFPRLVSDGSLMDITELFPKYAPDVYNSLSKEAIQSASFQGKVYAVPTNVEGASRRVAIVREDLRVKYNVPEIKTYDDLEVYLDAIVKNEPDIIPLVITGSDLTAVLFSEAYGYVLVDQGLQLVIKADDPEMKVLPWEQTPEYHELVLKMMDWYNKGYFPKDILNYSGKGVQGGRVAASVHVWGSDVQTNRELKMLDPSYECKMYPLYTDVVSYKTSPMNNAMVINGTADQPEAALEFINWVRKNQDNYDLFNYGIKGVHFIPDGDMLKFPEGVDLNGHTYIGTTGLYSLQESKFDRVMEGYPENWKQINSDFANLNTVYSPIIGFNVDFSNVKTEIAKRSTLISDTGAPLERGLLTEADIDKYIASQKAAGADVIAAEVQKQLDQWRKDNK